MAPKAKTKAELKAEAAAEAARLAEIAEQERQERERREAEEYAAAQQDRREKINMAEEALKAQHEELQEERRQRVADVALVQRRRNEERESDRFFHPTHLPVREHLGLGTEIPRPIITNNVSLRLLHLSDDPFHFGDSESVQAFEGGILEARRLTRASSDEQFACTLGGVLVVEILEARRRWQGGGADLEADGEAAEGRQGLAHAGGEAACEKLWGRWRACKQTRAWEGEDVRFRDVVVPPMTVRYTLPDDILLFEPPVVARYDQASRTWVEEDINETSVSDDAHVDLLSPPLSPLTTFSSLCCPSPPARRMQALLPPQGLVQHDRGQRVSAGYGLEDTSADKQGRKKLDSVSPAVFFFHLREMGIFLEPELDRKQLNLSKKSEEIEEDLHRGLSVIAQGVQTGMRDQTRVMLLSDFSIKMSQLNKELPPYMAGWCLRAFDVQPLQHAHDDFLSVVAIKPAEWLSETEAEKDSWKFALFRERQSDIVGLSCAVCECIDRGEAKFEVEDNLRCCCIVPDDIVKKKEAPKEEDNDKDVSVPF
eukprot:750786-Hanusia_phi.AAC.1